MSKGKSASLVTHKEEGIKCVYEIEGSNQKFFPQHPDYKVDVTIFPVTDADIKRNLRKILGFQDKKLSKKGFQFLLSGIKDPTITESNMKSKCVEIGLVDSDYHITKAGFAFLRKDLAEKLASIDGGDLAIDECSSKKDETKLVKFLI